MREPWRSERGYALSTLPSAAGVRQIRAADVETQAEASATWVRQIRAADVETQEEELPLPPPPVRGTVQSTNASEGSVQPTVAVRSAQLASARRAQSRGDRHKAVMLHPCLTHPKKAPMTCAYCGNVVRMDVMARHRKTCVCRQALSLTWAEIATGRLRAGS